MSTNATNSELVGVVFPGQGTQRAGMGAPWRDTEAWQLVEEISEWTGEDLSELLLTVGTERLCRTDLAQLSVFTVAAMAYAEAVRCGFLDGAVAYAGHSLGEYLALVAAGALPLRDAAVLVAARGRAMREATGAVDGTMGVLVGAPLAEVCALTEELRADGHQVWVANVNAPGQLVLSGTPGAVGEAAAAAPRVGAKLIRIPVGGAFHSPLIGAAAGPLRKALAAAPFAPRHRPVVANVDAAPHTGTDDWVGLLVRQLDSPVLWENSVQTLTGPLGCLRLVEVGPGRTLSGMIRRIVPNTPVSAFDAPAALV